MKLILTKEGLVKDFSAAKLLVRFLSKSTRKKLNCQGKNKIFKLSGCLNFFWPPFPLNDLA
jgi:hypothetical protein